MTVVRALEVVDELVDDLGSVVLLAFAGGHRVVRLSALGQAVRELTSSGMPFEQLVEALTERFGPPPAHINGADAVHAVLGDLESEGLIRVEG